MTTSADDSGHGCVSNGIWDIRKAPLTPRRLLARIKISYTPGSVEHQLSLSSLLKHFNTLRYVQASFTERDAGRQDTTHQPSYSALKKSVKRGCQLFEVVGEHLWVNHVCMWRSLSMNLTKMTSLTKRLTKSLTKSLTRNLMKSLTTLTCTKVSDCTRIFMSWRDQFQIGERLIAGPRIALVQWKDSQYMPPPNALAILKQL
ncbi:hypothetical protein QBC45DRAFT_27220 [Copromyces sp. CBS 386.78]|nr:hypothetical protein QBC45DRAFT_27220 [Copromyces sp. CBS 386.78]